MAFVIVVSNIVISMFGPLVIIIERISVINVVGSVIIGVSIIVRIRVWYCCYDDW